MFKGFIKQKYLFAGLALLQACGNPFNIKDSCETGFYETNSGNKMQWPDGSKVTFDAHSSIPEDYLDVIDAASNQYSDLFSNTSVEFYRNTNVKEFRGIPGEVTGDDVNAIYWVNEDEWPWKESDPQAIAMTVTAFSRSGIIEADIFYRAKSFAEKSTSSSASASTKVKISSAEPADFPGTTLLSGIKEIVSLGNNIFPDLHIGKNQILQAAYDLSSTNTNRIEHSVYMVSVHEMGHALGRCHSDEPASIMYPQVSAGTQSIRENPFSDGDLKTFDSSYEVVEEAIDEIAE